MTLPGDKFVILKFIYFIYFLQFGGEINLALVFWGGFTKEKSAHISEGEGSCVNKGWE